jgi:cell division protein FtsN
LATSATARVERPGVYILQAGLYRNETDADRVRIGLINKLDDLDKLRKQLQAADVDAPVIRVGD